MDHLLQFYEYKLRQALAVEDYETAAKLRDQMAAHRAKQTQVVKQMDKSGRVAEDQGAKVRHILQSPITAFFKPGMVEPALDAMRPAPTDHGQAYLEQLQAMERSVDQALREQAALRNGGVAPTDAEIRRHGFCLVDHREHTRSYYYRSALLLVVRTHTFPWVITTA